MIAHLLTSKQAELLYNNEFMPDNKFNPVQDINGNWFISIQEVAQTIVHEFMWVKDLPQSNYIPPIQNTEFTN